MSLTTAPARGAHARIAVLVVAGFALAVALAAPHSRTVLVGSEPLLPAYAAALFINELITFTLLAGIFLVERSRAVLVLASGYLFGSLTIVPWVLSFPGVFPLIGLDAGLQGTALVAAVRRVGFPAFVLAYALLRERASAPPGRGRRSIVAAIAVVAASVAAITALVVWAQHALPPLMRDTRHVTLLWQVVPAAALLLYAGAFAALWRGRPTILDLWLMVVVVTLAFEVALLSYVSGGVRLSVGWWVGRLCGLASASTVLVVLLSSTTALYARLARSLVEERHARANRLVAMEALSAAIAHEVNQPLASMVTNANAGLRWLHRTPPDHSEVTAALERIVADGHRTGALVRNIRALFRDDTGDDGPVAPNAVIRDVVAARGDDAHLARIAIALELREVPPVRANRVHLQLVVGNLLANAIDAAASGGSRGGGITISTALSTAGEVEVAVADTGPGIEPGIRARMFDPFVTTKPDGMGMGLMICRSIVEAAGGWIAADDNRPHGTVVRFALPPAAVPGAEGRAA
ncbi:ATP-binding protein [Acuticoccus sp. I52.16.1]|uniref:ATP-binding protein n=1 Tax=Acuticoccus sp. I52.16.1 TaxID=2928472 RepID=UPI001FD40713|nr:ATP-binding protein [Acuticoccus sp. I52.16.1]UOM35036.1 MASE4 domain-containing protein [Acuticoccus sp. I52.16.1]